MPLQRLAVRMERRLLRVRALRARRQRRQRPRAAAAAAAARARSFGAAFAAIAAVEELKALQHHAEFAALLAGLLVVPLVEPQAAFHQDRAALLQVLANGLRLPAKGVDINKGDFFLGLAGLGLPRAIDRQADLGDGHALWACSAIPDRGSGCPRG